jgi:hypothetical protein
MKPLNKLMKGERPIKGIRQELEPMKPMNKLIKGEKSI